MYLYFVCEHLLSLAFYTSFNEQLREWFHEQEKHEKRVHAAYRVEKDLYKVLYPGLEDYLPTGIVWCPVKRRSQQKIYHYFALERSLKKCGPNAIKKTPMLVKCALELVSTIVVHDLPFTSLPLDKVGRVSESGSLVLLPGSAIKVGDEMNSSEMAKTLEPFLEHSKDVDQELCKFGLELKRLLTLEKVDDAKALIIAQVEAEPAAEPDLCGIDNWHQMRLMLQTNEKYKDRVDLVNGKIVFHDIEDDDPVLRKARALWYAYDFKMDLANMRNEEPLFPELAYEPEPGQTLAEAFGDYESEAPDVPQRETLRLADGIELVMTPQVRQAVWNALSNGTQLTFDLPQEAKSLFQLLHHTATMDICAEDVQVERLIEHSATKTIFSVTRGIMRPCDPDEELDWSIPEDADVIKRIPQSLERSDSPKRARFDIE